MTSLRRFLWPGLALLAALAVRLYCIHAHPHIEGDALIYGDLAKNMLQHHTYGFSEDGGIRQTLIRLPGYPLFIAACWSVAGMEHYNAVLYGQLVFDLATCCLLGALAARIMGRRACLAALWLAALCPFLADYVAAGYTETLAIFCVTLAFFALERWNNARIRPLLERTGGQDEAATSTAQRADPSMSAGSPDFRARASHPALWLAILALTLAFNTLLRPDRALLAVAVVAAMLWLTLRTPQRRGAGLVSIAAVCLAIALPLAAWTARNERVFHVFQPLAPRYANDPGEFVSDGFNRWYRTWAIEFQSTFDIYWNWDGQPIDFDKLPARAFDSAAQRDQTEAAFAAYNDETAASPEIDAPFAAIAADRIRAHPFRYYVDLPIARVANMWLRPRTEMLDVPLDWWHFNATDNPRGAWLAAAYGVINALYLVLALVGLIRWKRSQWSGLRPIAFALLAFVLMRSAMLLTMDNSEPRYTLDCYPVIILLAAFVCTRRPKEEQRVIAAHPSS